MVYFFTIFTSEMVVLRGEGRSSEHLILVPESHRLFQGHLLQLSKRGPGAHLAAATVPRQ